MNMVNRISKHIHSFHHEPDATAVETAQEQAGGLHHLVQTALEGTKELVVGYPLASLTAAVVAGVAFGWWVKRK